MNHNWAQISKSTPYQAHLKKQTFHRVKKEKIKMKLQEVIFQKSETARLPGTELSTDNSEYGGYITRLWNWMFWIDGLSWMFLASSFCDSVMFLFFHSMKLCFF